MKHDHNHEGEVKHKLELPEGVTVGFARFKRHMKENRKAYLISAGCAGVSFVAGKHFQRPIVIDFKPVINNLPTIAPVFNNHNIGNHVENVVNNVGRCCKIVQRVSDKEIFEKAGDAAFEISEKHGITYDRARWMLSRHLNGYLDDVFGEIYKTLAVGTTD